VKFLLPQSSEIEQAEIPAALAGLAALQVQLAARLMMTPHQGNPENPAPPPEADDLLDTAQAAAVLKCSAKWLYRHAQQLSAVRRGREYLWSRRAINRWLARQRA
jgi:hypothetical protein